MCSKCRRFLTEWLLFHVFCRARRTHRKQLELSKMARRVSAQHALGQEDCLVLESCQCEFNWIHDNSCKCSQYFSEVVTMSVPFYLYHCYSLLLMCECVFVYWLGWRSATMPWAASWALSDRKRGAQFRDRISISLIYFLHSWFFSQVFSCGSVFFSGLQIRLQSPLQVILHVLLHILQSRLQMLLHIPQIPLGILVHILLLVVLQGFFQLPLQSLLHIVLCVCPQGGLQFFQVSLQILLYTLYSTLFSKFFSPFFYAVVFALFSTQLSMFVSKFCNSSPHSSPNNLQTPLRTPFRFGCVQVCHIQAEGKPGFQGQGAWDRLGWAWKKIGSSQSQTSQSYLRNN